MGDVKKPSVGWKIWAAFMIALFGGGLIMTGKTKPVAFPWLDWIALPIDFLALAGLLIYAYAWPAGRSPLWRKFSFIYPAWILIEIAIMVIREPEMRNESMRVAGYVGATIITLLLATRNWIAARRLGGEARR